ncbi:hypothetical protein L2E82_32982 [Cichorium intybus]|uniref:Uncharacterized protein n=1 Tax=Cichorium intybus TaxID=13427 RepID=A0ACB9BIH1_CICIN|nr:hypothetical protein L2E82_32982 [Cichorium intybus]
MNPSRRQQHHHVAAARASFQCSFLRSLKDAYSGGSEDRTIDAIIGLRLATAPFCVHCLVEIGIIFNHTTRNYDYVQLLGVRLKQFLNMSGEEEENAIEDRRRTGCLEGTSNGELNDRTTIDDLDLTVVKRHSKQTILENQLLHNEIGMKAKPSMMNKVKKGSTKLVASTANFLVYAFQMVGGTFGFQLHLQHRKA